MSDIELLKMKRKNYLSRFMWKWRTC